MKSRSLIAVLLLLVGTNLFVYATTRQWTTKHVLTNAKTRLETAMRDVGLYDQVFPADDSQKRSTASIAIALAGGRYYWWNDAIPYWAFGGFLTVSGLAVAGYRPKAKAAA